MTGGGDPTGWFVLAADAAAQIRHGWRLLRQRRREYRLVIAQMVVTFLIVALADLTVLHGGRLARQSPGFAPEQVLILESEDERPAADGACAGVACVWRVAAARPEVATTALTTVAPFHMRRTDAGRGPEVCAPQGRGCFPVVFVEVTPSFAEVVQLGVLRGRFLAPETCTGDRAEAVVTQDFLAAYTTRGAPAPAAVTFGGRSAPIVGVVASVRYFKATEPGLPMVFLPLGLGQGGCQAAAARPGRDALVVARVNGPREVAQTSLTQALDAALGGAYARVEPPPQAASFPALFFGVGLSLMGLAAVTLVGVIFIQVQRRSGELGLRRAIGATASNLFRQLMLEMLLLACRAGVIGAVVLAHAGFFLHGLLLPTPVSLEARFAAAGEALGAAPLAFISLVTIVLLAAWPPCRLALRITPVKALHDD